MEDFIVNLQRKLAPPQEFSLETGEKLIGFGVLFEKS
jgi:hypothetical protein